MATLEGFEPSTSSVTGSHTDQLYYSAISFLVGKVSAALTTSSSQNSPSADDLHPDVHAVYSKLSFVYPKVIGTDGNRTHIAKDIYPPHYHYATARLLV